MLRCTNCRLRSLPARSPAGFSPSRVAVIYATEVASVLRFATVLVLALACLPPPPPTCPTAWASPFLLFPPTLRDSNPGTAQSAILCLAADHQCTFISELHWKYIRLRLIRTMAGNDKTGSGPSSPKDAASPVGKEGSGPSSPAGKQGSGPSSPTEGSPRPSAAAGILPAQHWVQAAEVRRQTASTR